MFLRVVMFLSMAFGIIGLGGVGWFALHNKPKEPPAPMVVEAPPAPVVRATVLIASKPVRAGSLLKPDDISTIDMLPAEIPEHALVMPKVSRSDLVGAMLRRNVQPNEPLVANDVMLPGEHGFLAAVLAPGTRAATVGVDAISGSGGLIWPGDRVDLILTQAIEDTKVPAGRRLAGEVALANVRVVAVDQTLVRGAVSGGENNTQQVARTVTLEVTPAQAEKVAVATRIGKVQVVVRAADDSPIGADAEPRTTWASDVSRALVPSASDNVGGGSVVHVFMGTADGKEYRF